MPEEPEQNAIPLPPPEPVVGEPVPPVDQSDGENEPDPNYIGKIVSPPIPVFPKQRYRKAVEEDLCLRRLQKRRDYLKQTMPDFVDMRHAAWLLVVKAYRDWQIVRNREALWEEKLADLDLKMKRRRLVIRDSGQMLVIRRMKRFLGTKFNMVQEPMETED